MTEQGNCQPLNGLFSLSAQAIYSPYGGFQAGFSDKQEANTKICTYPSLSLFSEIDTIDNSDVYLSAHDRALTNLGRPLPDAPLQQALNVMASNALSTFNCLIHANFLHLAKMHLVYMKKQSKVVCGFNFSNTTLMNEARGIVSRLMDIPNPILRRSPHLHTISKLESLDKPIRVVHCAIKFSPTDRPMQKDSDLPVNLLMTTKANISGSLFTQQINCSGLIKGKHLWSILDYTFYSRWLLTLLMLPFNPRMEQSSPPNFNQY